MMTITKTQPSHNLELQDRRTEPTPFQKQAGASDSL